jgi:diguanylate cyclase (GGDEF)-like protein/PAS domain S-box-containing protein
VQATDSIPVGGAATDEAGRQRALREALAICMATFVAAAAGILGLWIATAAIIRTDYREHLTNLAVAAAQQIDPALHDSLRDPAQINGPDYRRAVEPLRRMRMALPEVHYIYTMVRDAEGVHFVLDAADPIDNDGDGVNDQAGLWEIYEDIEPSMAIVLGDGTGNGRATATDQPESDKWGTFMTGWAPLVDGNGRQYGILGVDIDASRYLAHVAGARFWALLGLLPATLLIIALGVGYYRVRLAGLNAGHRAEQAARLLTSGQRRLASIVEGTSVATWDAELDDTGTGTGNMTVDARWAAMLGRDVAELNPLSYERFFATLLHPDDAGNVRKQLDRALREEGRLLDMDVRLRHADGHWVWTEVRGKVIERTADGRPLRIVGTQMDASARKAAEQALIESETNFRSLFELSPVGIALCEVPGGRFLQVNDSLVESTGYSREELLEMRFWDVTPPELHEAERRELGAVGAGGHFGPYEKEYQRKDGSRYPVLVSALQMRDTSGRLVSWAIVQDISERKAMELELSDAAHRDRLTGLANRALFMERLQAAVERVQQGRQQRFAVLFLDFDRFKLVNDALGHEAGDGLLREIAARLRGALGVTDTRLAANAPALVARFGGDEFLVLLNDLPDVATAERIAERLLTSLSETYSVHGRDVYSSASIGIVTSEQSVESAEAVVRNADVAMYEAKRSGRACAVVFDDAMRARLTRYVSVDANLRKALGTPEFTLVYQPIVDLDTQRMTSVEALARWNHPTLGQVPPTEFIQVAEESGLIATLGQWVLREACCALAAWRARDPATAPKTVSVNVSRAELAQGERLLGKVRQALRQSGLPPECLRLEVTERDVMRDPAATLKLMRALRDMGVRLAMDDFGTGTSSLGCLRDYPFDVIKIDQSFINDVAGNPDVLAVLHAAITLVENLGKTSVAEGVENAQQVAILQSLGCHHAQGYYFSRPLTQQEVQQFMAAPPGVAPQRA